MKILITFGFIFLFGWLTYSTMSSAKSAGYHTPVELTDTIQFSAEIQPILAKNCSPCHFPGGKMYERMPFDQDTTIISHDAGVLKRLKGDENAILKKYLDQHKDDNNN